MPLRDHFRPPLDDMRPWEALHAGWPMMIVAGLRRSCRRAVWLCRASIGERAPRWTWRLSRTKATAFWPQATAAPTAGALLQRYERRRGRRSPLSPIYQTRTFMRFASTTRNATVVSRPSSRLSARQTRPARSIDERLSPSAPPCSKSECPWSSSMW
jgi:hypothetical protein